MNWSPASSGASVASSSSDSSESALGNSNEPLTVQDIEEWHNQTTAAASASANNNSFASTLENNTLGSTAGGGSSSSSRENLRAAAGTTTTSAVDDNVDSSSSNNNKADNDETDENDDNRPPHPPRQVVAGLPWTDTEGNEGMYTGEVNDDNVPDGLGLFRYTTNNDGEQQQQQQQEGEWRDGNLIRKKGVKQGDNNLVLSTIEEETSVHRSRSAPKYSEEFANFLANKQIDHSSHSSHSSNSMEANTTGNMSNARDFDHDSELYSSTNTRQSSNLYASTNSRRSHVYSSTNSRPASADLVSSTMSNTPVVEQQDDMQLQQIWEESQDEQQQEHQAVMAASPSSSSQQQQEQDQQPNCSSQRIVDDSYTTTTQEEDESGMESGDEYEHRHRNRQKHEELNAVEEEEIGSDSYKSGKVSGDGIEDYVEVPNHNEDIKYESDSEEDYDNGHNNNDIATSKMYDWHLAPGQAESQASLFPLEDSDDEPTLATHLQNNIQQNVDDRSLKDRFQGQKKRESKKKMSRKSSFDMSFVDSLDGTGGPFKSRRKFCLLFSACCVITIVVVALICWAVVRMQTSSATSSNGSPSNDITNSQSRDPKESDAAAELSLPWDEDTPCAYVTIELITDQYGNETSWALYHLSEVNSNKVQATRGDSSLAGRRNLLRSTAVSENNNRKMETEELSTSELQILSGGPYTYTDTGGSNYTDSICLPVGSYKFVMSDINGLCCQNGIGQYSIYFNGGRDIRMGVPGVFQGNETTAFEVLFTDVLTAMATPSPSQSLSPSQSISPSISLSPTIIPSSYLNMTTTNDIVAGTGNAYGLIFDIEMHQHVSFLTILGMDILVNADGPLTYTISTTEGSWRDLDIESAVNFQQSFRTVSSGTATGNGVTKIRMIDFNDVTLSNKERRQAVWIALSGDGLVYKNYDDRIVGSADEIKQKSSSEFDLYYGRAVMHYPFSNPRQDFRDYKGFVGTLWYSLDSFPPSTSPTVSVSSNGSMSLNVAPQSPQPTISNSSETTFQPSFSVSKDCSDNFCDKELTDGYLLRYKLNESNNTISMELTYDGNVWVGIAVSIDGQMAGSEAVIGSPDSGVPQKYRLGAGKIDLMSPEEQTLSDASVGFKDGKTVMKFTKPLVEPNQVPFVVGNNQMLWAYGSSPTISYHAKRSPFSLDLTASSLELSTLTPTSPPSVATSSQVSSSTTVAPSMSVNPTNLPSNSTIVNTNQPSTLPNDANTTTPTSQPSNFTNSTQTNSPTYLSSNFTNITESKTPTNQPSNYTNVTETSVPAGSSYPSASPSEHPTKSIAPTPRYFPSASPTTSKSPSATPTIFDPLLDIELLDSLSKPYTLFHIITGESQTLATSRRLQDEAPDSLYGFSTAVSADMSVMAVGATNAMDESGERSGAVFLYTTDPSDTSSSPRLVQMLYGLSPDSEFGSDVALSDDGNMLVVAARSENAQEGAIRMYERTSGFDSWEETATIVGAGEGFRAGWSVSISGDGSVVAMGSTKGSSNNGGIVTTYAAPDWRLYGSIIEAHTSKDITGFSVSLNEDGTLLAVGSVKATSPDGVSNAGRAEVFAMNGTAWNAEFEVFGETRQGYDGSSVALSRDGSLFVVGGRGFAREGTVAIGRCRVYERSGATGQYELLHTVFGGNDREELGWSAAISADGNKVACGGKGGNMLEFGETGVVRVWDRTSLDESELLPRGERFSSVEGSSFGSSVSLSNDGSMLVVGASTWNASSGSIFSFTMS